MHEIFNEDKYKEAATKAYDFIKRMLDPSEWEIKPYYGEHYGEDYAYKLMWGGAEELPEDATRIDPNYIQPDQYYMPGYKGIIKGICKLPEGEDPQNYAVAVYKISGESRSLECFCPIFTETAEDGTVTHTWSTGRLVEAWEYYLNAFDRDNPYMSDGQGGFVPWEESESGYSPMKYYKTEFTTTKVIYWYWADVEVGSESTTTYAYEIEFVRKDWNISITDEVKESYFSRPAQREGYVRSDYLGINNVESINFFDILSKPSMKETYSGWIGKDDLPLPTPVLDNYITDYETEIISQSFLVPDAGKRHRGFIEYGYSRFVDYKIYLYSLVPGDAEYLNAETSLWSQDIYPLPEVPPAIPPLVEEITDIVFHLGDSTSRRNITFLSTVQMTEGAEVYIPGHSTTAATCEGYITEKPSHVTYKTTISIPADAFKYVLRVGEVTTPETDMASRPEETNVYQFIAAGDPQITNDESINNWQVSLAKAFEMYPDAKFIATLGDNIDAQLDMSLAEQQFTGFLSPPETKTHPFLTVMGNHDDNLGFGGHFFAPNESEYGAIGGQGDFWTRYDETLFIVLNTNANDDRIQEHIDFIDETMAYYINAYGRPKWSIVMFHHSIFQPTSTSEEEQYVLLRNAFAPCFSKNRIDLVLMGHVHSYCRTHVIDCSELEIGDAITEAAIVPDSFLTEFTKTSNGQTLYITLNSASGSKYYPLAGEHWYVAKSDQELIPNISCVDVDNSRIVVTTHRTNDMAIVDQFTLWK